MRMRAGSSSHSKSHAAVDDVLRTSTSPFLPYPCGALRETRAARPLAFTCTPKPVGRAAPRPAPRRLPSGLRRRACARGRVLSPGLTPVRPRGIRGGLRFASPGSWAQAPRTSPRTSAPRTPPPEQQARSPRAACGRGAAWSRDARSSPAPVTWAAATASVPVLAAGVESSSPPPPPPPPPPADGAGISVPGPRQSAPATASVTRPGLGGAVMERGGTLASAV